MPNSLYDAAQHPLFAAQSARIASGSHLKSAKVPQMVPDFASVAVFRIASPTDIPVSVLAKTKVHVRAYTDLGLSQTIPAGSRLLRVAHKPPSQPMGVSDGEAGSVRKAARVMEYEAAFGLPWDYAGFIKRGVEIGHPRNFCKNIPSESYRGALQLDCFSFK